MTPLLKSADLEAGMLSTQEAAKLLGQPDSTLRRWRCERVGPPFVKYGPRNFRYPRAALVAYAAARLRMPSMHAA